MPVLENGPYVVFAPNNDAFAKVDPAELATLKTDPAALYKLDYYHVFLGLLGPTDVAGQRPTQQGAEIKVTGKDGDIKVNDTAKVICGGIQAANARIYIIDSVLRPERAAGSGHSDDVIRQYRHALHPGPRPPHQPRPHQLGDFVRSATVSAPNSRGGWLQAEVATDDLLHDLRSATEDRLDATST